MPLGILFELESSEYFDIALNSLSWQTNDHYHDQLHETRGRGGGRVAHGSPKLSDEGDVVSMFWVLLLPDTNHARVRLWQSKS